MLVPGYRQDHRGQTYQLEIDEQGGQSHVVVEVPTRPFAFRFFSDTKGHQWSFGERTTVESCNREACSVCGPARTNQFEVTE